MKIKEIEKTVTLSWSPSQQYPVILAAGTAAQQLDASFNTSAVLELYVVDLGDPALDMQLCGSVNSSYRFHKIVWGSYGYDGDSMEKGYIVGGCDSGNIAIYSPSKIMNGDNGLITTQMKHTGPVRAMDFNSYQKNLLATGASNSEIFIWDMNSTKTPMTPGAATQPLEDIVSLAWNKQVQHILGTVYSSRCVVWDLRKNEPIIKLSDSTSKIKWKDVVWNPDVATQLCLASEDDSYPVIQLWDLRFATSPIKTFEGHQKGVLSLSWCHQDPDLLISCGKDNKLLVWNPNTSETTGEIVCELSVSNQWNFEVSWCPRNPFLVASSSFDGHASIYSLAGGQPILQTSSKIADSFPGMNQYANSVTLQQQQYHHQPSVELRKPPKWLKRPCGVSFVFGGKLVTFGSNSKSVYVSHVVTKQDVYLRAKELQTVLEGNSDIITYCYKKAETCPESYMKEVWNFLSTQFFKESTKPQMCRFLGTAEPYLEEKLNTLVGNDGIPLIQTINGFDDTEPNSQLLSSAHPDKKKPNSEKSFTIKSGNDIDSVICDALLLGKLDVAVQLCLQEKRMAEAMILAVAGGPDLISKVQSKFFEENNSPLSDVIAAVVTNDWYNVVQICDLKNWKQVLVSLLTYTRDDDYQTLCDYLGERLENESDVSFARNALICYVCSGNINQLIESCKKFGFTDVQELTELALIMKEATMSVIDREFALLLLQYGELLASEGFLDFAGLYLENINVEAVISLKDRIHAAIGISDPYPTKHATVRPSNYFAPAQQQVSGGPVNFNHPPKSIVKPYSSSLVTAQPPAPIPPQIKPHNVYPTTTQINAPTPPLVNQFAPPPKNTVQPYSTLISQSSSVISNQTYPSRPPSSNTYPSNPTSMYSNSTHTYGSQPPNSFQTPLITPGYVQNSASTPLPSNMPLPSVTPSQPTTAPPPSSQLPYSQPKSTHDGPVTHSKSKYLVDPSVQSGGGYHSYSSATPNMTMYGNPSMINTPGDFPNQMNQDKQFATSISPLYPQGIDHNDIGVRNQRSNSQSQASYNPQRYTPISSPSGWNDPPSANFSKPPTSSTSQVGYVPPNPITRPLPGGIQQNTGPPNVSYSTSAQNVGGFGIDSGMYNDHLRPGEQHQSQAQMPLVNEVKPKPPMPQQYVYWQTALEELRNRCYEKTNNMQMKRKLEDVARKLDMLYDCIRSSTLSDETLNGLREIVDCIQRGNYQGCLAVHSQLVSGPQFSVIASFMPGIKVLVQSALQLEVYLM